MFLAIYFYYMKQELGYIIYNGKKILVLSRFSINRKTGDGGRSLKFRKTGKEGRFFSCESDFLQQSEEHIHSLINGKVIHL